MLDEREHCVPLLHRLATREGNSIQRSFLIGSENPSCHFIDAVFIADKRMALRIPARPAAERASLEEKNRTDARTILSLHPYFCQSGSIVLPIITPARGSTTYVLAVPIPASR
jgi:hypothetical protein